MFIRIAVVPLHKFKKKKNFRLVANFVYRIFFFKSDVNALYLLLNEDIQENNYSIKDMEIAQRIVEKDGHGM